MFDLNPVTDVLLCFALGLGASIVGVLSLCLSRRRVGLTGWITPLVVCVILGVPALGLAMTGTNYSSLLPLVLLASFFGGLAAARSPILETASRRLIAFSRRVWVAPICLVVLGLSLIGWQIRFLDHQLAAETDLADRGFAKISPVNLEPIPGWIVQTDKGRDVQMMRLPVDPEAEPEDESAYVHSLGLDFKVIQTGPGDDSYNCHGWVFAEGKAWISGEVIERILEDNDYHSTSKPTGGDVVIFRKTDGKISHTAIVRSISDDGRTLIESKWGKMGRYIHTLDQHAYQHHQATFYHTSRGGHQLRAVKDAAH